MDHPSGVLAFHHLPKCGGISLSQMISRSFPYTCRTAFIHDILHLHRLIGHNKAPDKKLFVYGHFSLGIHSLFPAGKVYYITLLRHPFKRFLSAYNYCRSIGLPPEVTAEEFMKPRRNFLVRQLSRGKGLAEAKRMLTDYFDGFAILERLPESLDFLSKKYDLRIDKVEKLNSTPARYTIGASQAEKLEEQFHEQNADDYEFYSFASRFFTRVINEMQSPHTPARQTAREERMQPVSLSSRKTVMGNRLEFLISRSLSRNRTLGEKLLKRYFRREPDTLLRLYSQTICISNPLEAVESLIELYAEYQRVPQDLPNAFVTLFIADLKREIIKIVTRLTLEDPAQKGLSRIWGKIFGLSGNCADKKNADLLGLVDFPGLWQACFKHAGIECGALFGAGTFTRKLDCFCGKVQITAKQLCCVMDDASCQQQVFGATVIQPTALQPGSVDAIIVSSDSKENVLLKRCFRLFGDRYRIFRISKVCPFVAGIN